MDPSLVVAEKETFFFQQSLSRRAPKRYRKQPEDLPHDLRFAHLNPRVAAYLASKEKEQKIPNEFDDGLGNKSLLPQINQTVSLIRHRLDSFLSSESDAQRVQFEETKARSSGILDQLARLLSLFEGLKVHLPASLEQQLLYSWKELTAEAKYSNRDWQIPANKEAYEKSQKSDQSSRGEDGKDSEPDDETRTSEGRRNKSKTTGKTTNACHSREESLEGRTAGDNTTTVRLVEPGVNNLSTTNKTRDHYNKNTARSRMTSSKSRAAVQYPGDYRDNRPASAAGSRCSLARGKTGIRAEDTMSVLAESMSDGTRSVAQPSFVQTIQFQLSSKACDERGWIVHQGSTHDKEMKNVLEWATQRLQACKRHRAEEKSLEEEMYLDQQPTLKFYGDGQKEQIQKYKGKGRERLFTRLNKDQSPKIPKLPDGDGRPLLMATTCDGSSTIFYPDGRPAIVSSRSSIGKPGYYTFVYDDSPEQKLLAMFTPSGRSCCYHDNGVIHFLTNESGGTMAENNGAINKRWTWPSHGTKLPVTISFHINSCVLFKCSSQTHMQLSFSCQKEQVKMNVGMTPGAEDPPTREDMGHLLTGIVFSSHTSKEFSRPYKPKTSTTRTKTKAKGKNKSPIPASELQKLLADLPMEKTENDANADKELIKLNRKVRILTEDWLEHYRIAVGMMAPQLKSMNDVPFRKTLRNINSAKSSPAGGGIVIIESPATQVVKATLMYRAPSAPVARCERPHSATSETVSEQQPTVKFVEAPPEEIEVSDQVSVERMTPFLSTTTSITGSQGKRTKSAPLHGSMCNVEALAPSLGLCTGALRQALLGEEVMTCRCSRHHIPAITDIEYDTFIQEHLPHEQLLIISVVSSIFPDSNRGQEVLQKMYSERNKNRAKPCLQSRGDPFRILLYDMATAANSSDHTQPLLLRRHNVVAGMFLMYQAGKLLFCDHIFNGYGNERKDLEKQMIETRKLASLGHSLPNDFHFSPQHGRHGLRSPWGGEIGGAGVDRHGSAGLSLANLALKKSSGSSSESSETSERQYAFQINPNIIQLSAAGKLPPIHQGNRLHNEMRRSISHKNLIMG